MAESFTISESDAKKSRRAGFTGLWPVPRHVILRGDLIYPGRQRRPSYAPAAHRELAQKFSKLDGASDQEIMRFIGTWGHLGYSHLGSTPDVTQLEADPIDWIRDHAHGVKTCFELLEHLDPQNVRHGRLKEYVDSLSATDPRGRRVSPAVRSGIRSGREILIAPPSQTAAAQAADLLSRLISKNTSGVSIGIGNDFEERYQFTALIEMVWWHLMKVAKDRLAIARCLACDSPFERTHLSQKYCPPSGPSKESTCGRSHRARTQRRHVSARSEE